MSAADDNRSFDKKDDIVYNEGINQINPVLHIRSKKSVQLRNNETGHKLKAKKKYFVRIRTYIVYKGKKYYSAWSKSKTVKTKK